MRTRWVSRNTSGRDIVVGDVHGCFRTLDRALGAIAFDSSQDRLFGVGDLVNRGPHSADALDWLEQRFEFVVLGNHDRSVLSWFRAKRGSPPPANAEWLLGVSRREHRRWRRALEGMPLAITIETRHGVLDDGAVALLYVEEVNSRHRLFLLQSGFEEEAGISAGRELHRALGDRNQPCKKQPGADEAGDQ